MSHVNYQQSKDTSNLSQILASEARLSRIHRLFKQHYNVTEPSLILEPYLFLGNCISANDTNRLSKLGIRYILNVAIRDVEICPYYSNDIRTLAIDLRDDDRENILRTFDQTFAFIDEAKRTKSRVLVHCSHGQSRSPAIVIAYLMRSYNVSLEQCLIHVIKARPCILPNDGFLKQLIFYDRFLTDRRNKQKAADLMKIVNESSTTEIPIQHNQSTPPIILAPAVETFDTAKLSSVDSSSLAEISTSTSIHESASADSIQIIPIQVSKKVPRPKKVEPDPVVDESPVKESKKNLKEKVSTTDFKKVSKKSNQDLQLKKRQSDLVTTIVKRSSTQTLRSHSAHAGRKQVNHSKHLTSSSNPQWEVFIYQPTNYQTYNERPRIKYITEIYDKATNRFIPTTC